MVKASAGSVAISKISFGENIFGLQYVQYIGNFVCYSDVTEYTVTSESQTAANGVLYKLNTDDEGNPLNSCTIQPSDDVVLTNGALTIPAAIDGVPVTAIAADAFAGNTALKSIALPSTITVIGARAFKGCTNLSTMTCSD